ncbi:unnamed protein product [Rotaria socialis]|uniref:Choline transporter-like protein n=1 Tax=Rotaria socialis TaxID=392032 RepID=A0A820QUX3_9BILA|nr:unnamed protein product [Rotaria socialis]CAF4426010.1 unnamed protein product [Rotaria socialis]
MFNDSITVNIPLKSDDDTEVNINNDPPAYQNPHLDFNEGRKDFSIAIVFGIHIIVVIVVGIVLGLPIVLQHMKQISLAKRLRLSADFGIKHFVYSLSGAAVVACTVGDWWFSNDDCRLYGMSNSIKRAFTTNLGTICFGSLFQAKIKTLRFFTGDERRKSIIAYAIDALTGEGFVQASRSFIKLFEERGWTAIINDSIIVTTLMFINIGIGLISAVAGGSFIYLTMVQSSKPFFAIICISSISFLIGLFISSIFTTLLASCVRTVFVCFALHPAALGATHPEHLEKLTTVWHKFYPEEFASTL